MTKSDKQNESIYRLGRLHLQANIRAGYNKQDKIHKENDFITSQYAIVYYYNIKTTMCTADGKVINAPVNSVIQRFPDQKHSIITHNQGRKAYLAIPAGGFEMLKSIYPEIARTPVLNLPPGINLYQEFISITHELKSKPDSRLMEVVNRILQLITRIYHLHVSLHTTQPGFREEAENNIRQAITSGNPLPTIAENMHMSYSSFRQLFKKETGISPGKYLIQCRMEKARELLSDTTMSVSDVAGKLNYPDIYTFSRQFKKYCRISPSQFQKDDVLNN